MISDRVPENMEELPSTIGSGWLQVSVDDPKRDKRIIIENLMRELCIADQQATQNDRKSELTIEDFWSLKAFNPNYVQGFLKEFEKEKDFIRMNPTGGIVLTETGRKHCRNFT